MILSALERRDGRGTERREFGTDASRFLVSRPLLSLTTERLHETTVHPHSRTRRYSCHSREGNVLLLRLR